MARAGAAPEASAAILLFVLVIFIEPMQRLVGRTLQETAQREMDRVHRLMAEIQQEARQGDLRGLREFIERRARETFELAAAKLSLSDRPTVERDAAAAASKVG